MGDLTWPKPGAASEQSMQSKVLSMPMVWDLKSLKDYINELVLIPLQTSWTCHESGSCCLCLITSQTHIKYLAILLLRCLTSYYFWVGTKACLLWKVMSLLLSVPFGESLDCIVCGKQTVLPVTPPESAFRCFLFQTVQENTSGPQ